MKLSHDDIERLAVSTLTRFMGELTSREKWVKPINIETLAMHQLGLTLDYTRLDDFGKLPSITTYADTEIKLRQYLRDAKIAVPANTIVLDEKLRAPAYPRADTELFKRRFRIAHGCAHQILHRAAPAQERAKMDASYIGRVLSMSEFNSLSDWREWQANALAAALLMPGKYLALLLRHRRLKFYGNRLNQPDKLALANICDRLKVSQTAMTLRLCQTGYASKLPANEYFDPTDIECDDDFFNAQASAISV